jgi:hypothetical protein
MIRQRHSIKTTKDKLLGAECVRALLCALLLGPAIFAAAAEETSPQPRDNIGGEGSFLIAKVEYRGSYKTRIERLEAITGLRAGSATSYEKIAGAEKSLRETELYTSVKIDVADAEGGKDIVVNLVEKMTLVPLPIAGASSGSTLFGLFVFNSDFLGSGDSAYAGIVGASHRLTGNLGYFHRAPDSPGYGINASGGYAKVTESDADGSSYAEYGLWSAALSSSLSFQGESPLRLSALADFSWAQPEGEDARLLDNEYLVLLPGIGLGYEALEKRDWFKTGLAAQANYKLGFPLLGDKPYQVIESKGSYSLSPFGFGDLLLGGSLVSSGAPEPLRPSLMGNGFRTLPWGESFSSQAGSAYLQYEAPVINLSWATFTACSFYEAGSYRMGVDMDAPWHSFSGPGIGARFYLKNIAIPALGVDCAYNVPERNLIISAALGFSM